MLPSCRRCCRQVAPRCLLSGFKSAKMPSWSHLGGLRGAKNYDFPYVFVCFCASRSFAVRSRKIAQEGPKMAPRWPQDGPKMAPRRPQEGPKTAPRRPQDGSQWHLQLTLNYLSLGEGPPAEGPRCLHEGPRRPPRGPKRLPRGSKEAPRGPKTAPQRLPNCPQKAPDRLLTRSQRTSRGL